jgi:hypothetical protein
MLSRLITYAGVPDRAMKMQDAEEGNKAEMEKQNSSSTYKVNMQKISGISMHSINNLKIYNKSAVPII